MASGARDDAHHRGGRRGLDDGSPRGRRSGAAGLIDQPTEDVALDEPLLASGGLAHGGGRESVEVTHSSGGGLTEERSGVGGEELAVAAGAAEAHAEVFGGVVRREGVELEPMGKERAIPPEGEAAGQLGQPNEEEGPERAAVLGIEKICK